MAALGAAMESEEQLKANWQPISTAPRDRKFLGFIQSDSSSWIRVCAWSKRHRGFMPASPVPDSASWHLDGKAKGLRITHWMPLPNFPDEA